MDPDRATTAQRAGIFLGFFEACLLGFVAALHFGIEWRIAGVTFAAPFLYPAAIVEAVLALALLLGVLLPGPGVVRAGRVLGAQILTVIGVFASQVAFMRAPSLMPANTLIFHGTIIVLALTSVVLVASPMYRRRSVVR
jgi:hypothetical protein